MAWDLIGSRLAVKLLFVSVIRIGCCLGGTVKVVLIRFGPQFFVTPPNCKLRDDWIGIH